ncbi:MULTISPECIES: EAL domain-containing protein [unclassified Shewanella]|uniref:EAL domain-containing protein n=1 Tax=unclassified Shewanella TaxID=196818 RepID=UPI001BB953AB|nr:MULTISPECIES: EAL domain-containing protein [unclassified Shewanella]GIU20088.1 diguanylate phosphodiesterase [Shewanella sp. MBTL60-112-B1]GIU40982.1 diguanylate phosphodiesterase [Shewanella sp. MBTL60-112-B2]
MTLRYVSSRVLNWSKESKLYLSDLAAIALLLLPITLASSLAMLLGHAFRVLEIASASELLFYVSDILINLYPTTFCVVASYYLSQKTNASSAIFIIYALVLFYILSLGSQDFSTSHTLPNNPLLALLSAIATYLYYFYFPVRLLDPNSFDFASRLIKYIFHIFCFSIFALLLSQLVILTGSYLENLVSSVGLDPMTFAGGLIYQTLLGILGAVGINGHNMLFAMKQQIYADSLANIEAWQAGEASLNIISQGFYDAFLSMGGSGNCISLLLCVLIFSQKYNHRMLAIVAIPMVMFNINEVLLFGLPILFNPIMIIPFILVPLVSFVIVYACIALGVVSPVVSIVNWMTPPIFSGYFAMGEQLDGALLQMFVITVGIFIYRPFYLVYVGKHLISLDPNTRYAAAEGSIFNHVLRSVRDSTHDNITQSSAQKRMAKILRQGNLVMFYQKIQSIQNKEQYNYEALLRYVDDKGKLCSPEFILDFQLLEAMPLLDKLVIELVLTDMQKMDLRLGGRVSINVSVASIEKPDFVSHLLSRLDHYSIAPTSIEIEITEEAMLSDKVFLTRVMTELQQSKITIAMDDFGSGYASFPHLLQYPFNKVKIDRSLLLDAQSNKGKEIYKLVTKLGEIANCKIVAEGVETQQEFEFIENCGVDFVQGFYLARPLPLEKLHGNLAVGNKIAS